MTNFVSEVEQMHGISISYPGSPRSPGMEATWDFPLLANGSLKRAMDIVFTLLLSILFLPVFLLTALLVRLDLPGPILYTQERVGRNGRKMLIYKFRSMQVNAEKILAQYLVKHPDSRREWDATQKLREDPRITRVGKWLRKFSMDELPQLYNVLKGDMSLVGPRPIVESEVRRYQDYINVYSAVRPGVTGMWQVSGRNRTTYQQRVLYDVYYVRNWSVWLDINILLRTVWVVISRDGAY